MNETSVAPNEPSVATPVNKKKGRSWPWVLLLLGAAAGATYLYPRVVTPAADPAATKKGKGGDGAGGRAVPVVAAKARQGDMPVYLTGLGSVTALNTVTVHTRVDGELMKVAFTEGQLVNKDDLLVQIDPRPFQVQLEQAEGQMARDQAMLDNAKLDME